MVKVDEASLKYLRGELFSSGLDFSIITRPEGNGHINDNALLDRFCLLEQLCAGKNVIHIGCADHLGLIEKKRSEGTWIHGYLTKIASNCIGLDINREAIDYLQNKLGITNVIYADVTREIPKALLVANTWDNVFLGEIIEHINDPVHFLASLKEKLGGYAKELIITAPNALRYQNFANIRKGVECINSDHRYWFTPYTLAKIVSEAGFKPTFFYFVTSYKLPKPRGIRSYIQYRRLIRFPGFRDTIILRAEF